MNVFYVVFLIYPVYGSPAPPDLAPILNDLEPLTDEMINAINTMDSIPWKAGKNFNGKSFEEVKKMISTVDEIYDHFKLKSYDNSELPSSFDAREKWPNCPSISRIYKQDSCTPSWIYASVGQIADRICISYGIQIDVEKTVQQMIKYYGDCEYNSANIYQAFKYWAEYGIFIAKPNKSESHSENSFSDKGSLKEEIVDYFKLNLVSPNYYDDKMNALLTNGPIAILLDVDSDFLSYKSGIYKRISTKRLGTHAVKIVGWGVDNNIKYWLVENSWGVEWGDKGFFQIRRGEKEFGNGACSAAVHFTRGKMPSLYNRDQLFYLKTDCC